MITLDRNFKELYQLYEYLTQKHISNDIIITNDGQNKYLWYDQNLIEINNETLPFEYKFPENNIPFHLFPEKIKLYCNFGDYHHKFEYKELFDKEKTFHYAELLIHNEKYIIGKFYKENFNKDKKEDFKKYLVSNSKFLFYNKNFYKYHPMDHTSHDLFKNNKLLIYYDNYI